MVVLLLAISAHEPDTPWMSRSATTRLMLGRVTLESRTPADWNAFDSDYFLYLRRGRRRIEFDSANVWKPTPVENHAVDEF